jgi:hypothetical protein
MGSFRIFMTVAIVSLTVSVGVRAAEMAMAKHNHRHDQTAEQFDCLDAQ